VAIQFHPLTISRRIDIVNTEHRTPNTEHAKNQTSGLPRRLRLLAMTEDGR